MKINDVVMRRAVGSDAAEVAEAWLRSFTAALPGVRRAHTDDEVRAWIREVVVPGQEPWVAPLTGQGADAGCGGPSRWPPTTR